MARNNPMTIKKIPVYIAVIDGPVEIIALSACLYSKYPVTNTAMPIIMMIIDMVMLLPIYFIIQ